MLAAVVGGAAAGIWNVLRVRAAASRIALATELKARLAEVQQRLADAETAQRGFLLTGDVAYLQPYYGAVSAIAPTLDRVQALSSGGDAAARTVAHLRQTVAMMLTELEHTVDVRIEHGADAARAAVQAGASRTALDDVRADLDLLTAGQEDVLAIEQPASAHGIRSAVLFALIAALGGLLLAALAVHQSNRLITTHAARDRIAQELADATDDAARARGQLLELEGDVNRVRDALLPILPHEVRPPINAAFGWVRMLRSGGVHDDRAPEALQGAERNATIQHRLIEDLLDVSRVVAGNVHLALSEVDLTAVADAALSDVHPAASAKGVTLESIVDADLPRLHADPQRLQQVLWNLIANAVRFTEAGGHVWLEVRRSDRDVIVEVRDDGVGIAPESLPHVWERYHQASDGAPSEGDLGLGLGLAIVRHIVELHGGTAMAESPGRGRGSTFRIVLPASESTPAARRPRQSA